MPQKFRAGKKLHLLKNIFLPEILGVTRGVEENAREGVGRLTGRVYDGAENFVFVLLRWDMNVRHHRGHLACRLPIEGAKQHAVEQETAAFAKFINGGFWTGWFFISGLVDVRSGATQKQQQEKEDEKETEQSACNVLDFFDTAHQSRQPQ